MIHSGAVTVEALEATPPGPALCALLAGLNGRPLDTSLRVATLRAWERQKSWTEAQTLTATVAVAGATPATPEDWEREEVGFALGISSRSAATRVHRARTVLGRYPALHDALTHGVITWAKLLTFLDATSGLDPAHDRAVETHVLERAEGQDHAAFTRTVRRAVATATPPLEAELAHAAAREHRTVTMQPLPDGMGQLLAVLPADALARVWAAIEALAARRLPDDPRGIDARRADALVLLAQAATAPDRDLTPAQRRRAQVHVVIPHDVLTGASDAPAELAGYGWIPASLARRLAEDGDWRRLVTDPLTGHALDLGRTVYRPPRHLVEFLHARDRYCFTPACTQPATRCDTDHGIPYDAGGTTDPANCGPACERHHRFKHESGWTITRQPDGTVCWTSPDGKRTYERTPWDYR